jgi:hypothetical protein
MAEGFITREVTKASLAKAMAQSVIVVSQAEQTLRSPFGSTRSQVRNLSPRLTSHGFSQVVRAELRAATHPWRRICTQPSMRPVALEGGDLNLLVTESGALQFHAPQG